MVNSLPIDHIGYCVGDTYMYIVQYHYSISISTKIRNKFQHLKVLEFLQLWKCYSDITFDMAMNLNTSIMVINQ